jgi:hypothetical protein
MKSPLRKFRGLSLPHHHKERKDQRPPPAKLDELVDAAQVSPIPSLDYDFISWKYAALLDVGTRVNPITRVCRSMSCDIASYIFTCMIFFGHRSLR